MVRTEWFLSYCTLIFQPVNLLWLFLIVKKAALLAEGIWRLFLLWALVLGRDANNLRSYSIARRFINNKERKNKLQRFEPDWAHTKNRENISCERWAAKGDKFPWRVGVQEFLRQYHLHNPGSLWSNSCKLQWYGRMLYCACPSHNSVCYN